MIPKQIANKVLTSLDTAAGHFEQLAKAGKMDPRVASQIVRDIDTFADKFEVAAYGKENLQRRMAKVIKQDSDESYMKTFANPNKVIESEKDEPYMHKTDASARWDGIDNFDADRTTTVSERQEFKVVDQSPVSNGGKTEKQPSWSGAPKTHKASTKTWAD